MFCTYNKWRYPQSAFTHNMPLPTICLYPQSGSNGNYFNSKGESILGNIIDKESYFFLVSNKLNRQVEWFHLQRFYSLKHYPIKQVLHLFQFSDAFVIFLYLLFCSVPVWPNGKSFCLISAICNNESLPNASIKITIAGSRFRQLLNKRSFFAKVTKKLQIWSHSSMPSAELTQSKIVFFSVYS